MKDTILQDTVNTMNGLNIENLQTTPQFFNWWMWIAIIEFIILLFFILIFIRKFKKTSQSSDKKRIKNEAREGNVDFENIINSSFNAEVLYKILKVKCHPDRFPDIQSKEMNEIANELYQQINKNKNNLKILYQLKNEAEQRLNINIKN